MSFFWFARNTVHIMSRLLWNVRVYGREYVPRTGPLIIACNHVSNIDPPVMGSFVPRQISYMAKKELFEIPLLGPTIRALGAYPVDRQGSATAAIKRSVEILRAGGCIGIFPEGGRNVHGDKAPQTGVALLASLAKAPVVPAAIVGSERIMPGHQIKVAFGLPMLLPLERKATREDMEKFTADVMSAIHALAGTIGGNS